MMILLVILMMILMMMMMLMMMVVAIMMTVTVCNLKVLDVEESVSFSRLFSALNFLFCMPEAKGEVCISMIPVCVCT